MASMNKIFLHCFILVLTLLSGTFTVTASTPPDPVDAAVTRFDALESGCNPGLTTISIWIKNNGTTAINGTGYSGATVSYTVNGLLPAITEAFTFILAPGDSVKKDFLTDADLSAVGADVQYTIKAWITMPGDANPLNDTITKTITSFSTPPAVSVATSPDTTTVGSRAVLYATPTGTWDVLWYTNPVGGIPLFRGNRFTTPPLTNSITYYTEGIQRREPEAVININPSTFGNSNPSWILPFQGGIMLNIKPISKNITIRALDVHPYYTGISNVIVYYKSGSYTLNTADSTYWQVLGGYEVNTAAPGQMVHLKVDPLVVPAGQTMALYMVYAQEAFPVVTADSAVVDDILITCGAAHGRYFDPQHSNAFWNGKIWYDTLGTHCTGVRTAVPVHVKSKVAQDVAVMEILGTGINLTIPYSKSFGVKVENLGNSLVQFKLGYQIDQNAPIIPLSGFTLQAGLSQTIPLNIMFPLPGKRYEIKVFTSTTSGYQDLNRKNDTLYFTYYNPFPAYCQSYASNQDHQDIISVKVNNTSHTSAPTGQQYGLHYTRYTPVQLVPGDSCTITVTAGNVIGETTVRNCEVKIWIDWNNDGVFSQTERITTTYTPIPSTGTYTKTLLVPSTATAGLTGLRVQLVEPVGGVANPCEIFSYGETEDHLVEVLAPVQNDIGIVSVRPLKPMNVAENPFSVWVKFKNFGTSPSYNPVIVKVIHNNKPPVSYAYINQIASMASDSILISGLIPAYGVNDFTFEVFTQGDMRSFNNSMSSMVIGYLHASIPFMDDFELTQTWYSPENNTNWQAGVPAGITVPGAWSGSNVWKTNLNGVFNTNDADILYSPVFDMMPVGISDTVILSFRQWRDMPWGTSGRVEYTTDFGNTWFNLGAENDPLGFNWYDHTIAGQGLFSSRDTSWVCSSYALPPAIFNSRDSVQFRFVFIPGDDNNGDGWAIDDFRLTPPTAADDMAVVAITFPVNDTDIATGLYVSALIANQGLNPQSGVPVAIMINNNTVVTDTIQTTVPPGDTIHFTFTAPYQVPYLPYNLCVETRLPGDAYYWNDKFCKSLGVNPPKTDISVTGLGYPFTPNYAIPDGSFQKCYYHPQINPLCVYPLEVFLTNNGLDTITSLDLRRRWTTTGTFDSTNYQTWQGILAPGASMNVLMDEPLKPFIGQHFITIYAELAGDLFPPNDSIAIVVKTISCSCYGSTQEPDDHGIVLLQNVPNPAGTNTRIEFSVPLEGSYVFTIVDLLGNLQFRKTGNVIPGSHTVTPDISRLKKGVYLYFLEFNGIRLARRMIIQ
jgi:hypothetical protein